MGDETVRGGPGEHLAGTRARTVLRVRRNVLGVLPIVSNTRAYSLLIHWARAPLALGRRRLLVMTDDEKKRVLQRSFARSAPITPVTDSQTDILP